LLPESAKVQWAFSSITSVGVLLHR
jgi:hypothetical protein